MSKPYKRTKQEILEAINGCAGIILTVAKKLNVDWRTARRYINATKEAREAYEIEIQHMGDICESVLFEAIHKKRDVSSAKWYLAMRCKDRGYGSDVTNRDAEDEQLKIIIDDGVADENKN